MKTPVETRKVHRPKVLQGQRPGNMTAQANGLGLVPLLFQGLKARNNTPMFPQINNPPNSLPSVERIAKTNAEHETREAK